MSSRRSRPRFLVAVLVLLALTLITLSTRGSGNATLRSIRNGVHAALAPIDSGVHSTLRPIGDFISGAVHYGSLRAENARLRQLVGQDQATAAENQYLEAQAAAILRENDIKWVGDYHTVVAKVLAQPTSNFETTITLDKGSNQGVAVGQPVVAASGLAGQVTTVTGSTCVVTLITDSSLTVGVALPGGNIGGEKGQGAGHLLTVEVDTTGLAAPAIHKGDVVFTSGNDAFPQGIPVGRVASAATLPGQSEPSITLKPLADTGDLGYVAVVLWSGQ